MDDRFVTLASLLRATSDPPPAGNVAVPAASPGAAAAPEPPSACTELISELALMRLAALDAFEQSVPILLRRLAQDVLGRELQIAPVDIAALAKHALQSYAEFEPVSLAVSSADAQHVCGSVPVRVDPSLHAGDLVVEVRDGGFDARFSVRLQAVLAAALPHRA